MPPRTIRSIRPPVTESTAIESAADPASAIALAPPARTIDADGSALIEEGSDRLVATAWPRSAPFGDLWREVTHRLPDLPAVDVREFESRQAEVAHGLGTVALVVHGLCTLVLLQLDLPRSARWLLPVWAITSLTLLATSLLAMWWRTDDPTDLARRFRRKILISITALALLHGWVVGYASSGLEDSLSTLFAATLSGIIGVGAFCLAVHRRIALIWIWSQVVAVSAGMALAGEPRGLLSTLQLVNYGIALSVVVAVLSSEFERRFRAERDARVEHEVVSMLLDDFGDGARDWLWELDPAGCIVSPSPRFVTAACRSESWLRGRTLVDLLRALGGEGATDAVTDIEGALHSGRAIRGVEVQVEVAGGERRWSLTGRRLAHGRWRGVCSDITEDHRHRAEMHHLATHDQLTGLPNRVLLQAMVEERAADAAGSILAVAIVDLDDFKVVNDTLGHSIGDDLIAAVARRLEGAVRADDLCARLGGDEFAILLETEHGSPDELAARCQRLLDAVAEPFELDGTRLEVHASIGYATGEDSTSFGEVLARADLALYAAKDAGRGIARGFHPELHDAASHRAEVRRELREAIDRHQLVVWFQPQVDLRTGTVVGAEALVRWQHPRRGLLGPGEFIGQAEESALIAEVGHEVLRQVLASVHLLPPDIRVAWNVSPRELTRAGYVDRLLGEIRRAGVELSRLELEVTESTVVDERARSAIKALRAAGLRVALDDFGTGYSSLDQLRSLTVSSLKVDRSFVAELVDPGGEMSRVMMRAILEVADAFRLEVVVEGVETEAQADALAALGCRVVQGFHFGRPMPLEALQALGGHRLRE